MKSTAIKNPTKSTILQGSTKTVELQGFEPWSGDGIDTLSTYLVVH